MYDLLWLGVIKFIEEFLADVRPVWVAFVEDGLVNQTFSQPLQWKFRSVNLCQRGRFDSVRGRMTGPSFSVGKHILSAQALSDSFFQERCNPCIQIIP